MGWLRQFTACKIKIGPVKKIDDWTVCDSIAIAQSDVRISKNGGSFDQKIDTSVCSFDENGYFTCLLANSDTNKLGNLVIGINITSYHSIRHDYLVVDADAYDNFVENTGYTLSSVTAQGDNIVSQMTSVQAQVTSIQAQVTSSQTQINSTYTMVSSVKSQTSSIFNRVDNLNDLSITDIYSSCYDALDSYDMPTYTELDNSVNSIFTSISSVDARISNLNNISNTDVYSETYDALNTFSPALQSEVNSAITHVYSQTQTIIGDTNELQTDWANGGRLDLLIDAIKAKTDNQPPGVQRGVEFKLPFMMMLSSDPTQPAIGKTIAAYTAIDNNDISACTNNVEEKSAGRYMITLTNSEMSGSVITFVASATDCIQRTIFIKTST